MSKFGKAKYGGNKRNYFKIKDGDNVFAMLPPMNIGKGTLGDKGIWAVFYNVHYGYKNSEGKLRPFQSSLVKNRKTKMVEVSDPALERIEKLKAQLEAAKKSGDQKMVAKLNEFVGPKGSFNLDNNHYINALDPQGNIGVLKLRHRAKVALDAEIKRLREKGIDPLDPETLRYFVIRRTGTGLDTVFNVSVLTKTINVKDVGDVQQEVVTKLTDADADRIFSEAADLSSLFKSPTSAEIARLVAEGASAVDEILDGKGAGSGSDGQGDGSDYDDSADMEDDSSSAQSAAPATTQVASSQSAPTQAASSQSAPTTTASSVTAPVQAAAPAAAPVQASAPVVSSTAGQVNEMSDADFLKSIGL